MGTGVGEGMGVLAKNTRPSDSAVPPLQCLSKDQCCGIPLLCFFIKHSSLDRSNFSKSGRVWKLSPSLSLGWRLWFIWKCHLKKKKQRQSQGSVTGHWSVLEEMEVSERGKSGIWGGGGTGLRSLIDSLVDGDILDCQAGSLVTRC